MTANRIDPDYLYFLIHGSGFIDTDWSRIWGQTGDWNDHWTFQVLPKPAPGNIGVVDMGRTDDTDIIKVETSRYSYLDGVLVYTSDSSNGGVEDYRTADRITLDHQGAGTPIPYMLQLHGVDFVDAPMNRETHLQIITPEGVVTDGTVASITMHVGDHHMSYTGAARDATLFMGLGYDTVDFLDDLDVPGQQFWSVIRQDDGALNVYSLFSGNRVQLVGGDKGWTADYSELMNYGEVEKFTLQNYETGEVESYLPGVDLPDGGNRGTASNIDLRSDGELSSNSFNHAYFNYIRYTSDNVWAGEATIHDGTQFSTPSDRSVTAEKYGTDAAKLSGTLASVGQSRNGTHDLIVSEQANQAIDGNFRLYSFDVESGLYNQFNQVFLGAGGDDVNGPIEAPENETGPEDRVALYGFGGNDTLMAGSGSDYLFGGKSSYNPLNNLEPSFGNYVVGGDGADYFGVGHTDAAGSIVYVSPETDSILNANETIDVSTTFGETASLVQATATDQIGDWDAGTDTLVVLQNGVAIIENLKGLYDTDTDTDRDLDVGGDVIDLRSYLASATSDQNGSGARAGASGSWDADKTLEFIFENQQVRDALTILNEIDPDMTSDNNGLITNYINAIFDATDVTVRNEGIIVSKGGAGDDTFYGSFGSDYIYGGSGNNLTLLAPTGQSDGIDKVFVDGYFGFNEVRNFDVNEDQIYLNKDVLDWVRAGNGLGSEETDPYNNGDFQDLRTVNFVGPMNISPNLSGVLDLIYKPYQLTYQSILNDGNTAVGSNGAWSNETHYFAGDQASLAMIAAGSASVAIGLTLVFNPFTIIPGIALIATGTSQIVAGTTANPHQNAQITSEDRAIVTLLDNEAGITSSLDSADKFALLDFFYVNNPDDGFARALEFTNEVAVSNLGGSITNPFRSEDQSSPLVGYYAVHSNSETFIYRVASSDRIVTDNETYLVAEVAGLLDESNLEAYVGALDFYNSGLVAPDFAPNAVLSVTAKLSDSGRTSDTTINLVVALDADLEIGERLEIYRNDSLIATLSATEAVGGNLRSYAFEDDLSALVLNGAEDLFAYSAKTISKDGILRFSNNVSVIVDLEAPEIVSVAPAGDNTVSVIVTGSDISENEKAFVRLMADQELVEEIEITQTDMVTLLTIPDDLIPRAYTIEVADVRGNTFVDSTKIFALRDGDDGTAEAFFNISESGAITFALGGNDFINGTVGDDILVLGSGDVRQEVTLIGGNDTLVVSSNIIPLDADGGIGVDTVDFSQSAQSLNINLANGSFAFADGGTPTTATISNFENAIGSGLVDNITGTNGENVLRGGAGDDAIDGAAGDDRLIGGSGDDSLKGGTGNDVFVFDSLLGVDTITDFSSADDGLELSRSTFDGLVSVGELSDTAFLTGTVSTSADQRIIYDNTSGDLFYDADGSGEIAAIQIANFTGQPDLLHSDFSVIA